MLGPRIASAVAQVHDPRRYDAANTDHLAIPTIANELLDKIAICGIIAVSFLY
jgi:hypothetical protein